MTTGYQVHTYQSISPSLVQNFSSVLNMVLLNGVRVKKGESSLLVNPLTGHFQYHVNTKKLFGKTPQSEDAAKQELKMLMNMINGSISNLVQAGRLPEGLDGLFSADYFKQSALTPTYNENNSRIIDHWDASFTIALPAVENASEKVSTEATINEGFQIRFGSGMIKQLKYAHLPIIKNDKEDLTEALTNEGEQKTGVFYARNRDHTVVPFFTSNEGMLPASTISVLLKDDPDLSATLDKGQFPLVKVDDIPEPIGEDDLSELPDIYSELAPDTCTDFGFDLAFQVWCIEARRAVRYFSDGLNICGGPDSLDETISGWAIGESLEAMAGKYALAASFFMELSDHFKAHAANKSVNMSLRMIVMLWEDRITSYVNSAYKMKQARDKFNKMFAGRSQKEIQAYILNIVKGNTGLEGLPSALTIKRQMVEWWVNNGPDGRGKILWEVNVKGQVTGGQIATTWEAPYFDDVRRAEQVTRMVQELWRGQPLLNLPFDFTVWIYLYDLGAGYYDYTTCKGERRSGNWTGTGIEWDGIESKVMMRILTVSEFDKE